MTELPTPLTPADCDLRGLPFMPLQVVTLMDSDLFIRSTGDEFKAAVALWCKSWNQIPGGSLPNDDIVLADLSRAKNWKKVKAMALRGWILCSDGRLYHKTIAENAVRAWEGREEYEEKAKNKDDRQTRWRLRVKELCQQLRELGVTPPKGAGIEVLEGLLQDAIDAANVDRQASTDASTSETGDTSTSDKSEIANKGQGQCKGQLSKPYIGTDTHDSALVGVNSDPAACHDVGQICIVMRSYGINAGPGNLNIVELARQGVFLATLHAACADAKKKKPNEAISPNFVIGFIRNWKADADAMNVAGAKAPRNTPSSKDKSRAAAAASIGLGGKHEQRTVTIDGATGNVED